jgi:hypothetical protein
MAEPFNKFNVFVRDEAAGVHNLATGSPHVFKVMWTNTAPVAGNAVKADIVEIPAGGGYTAGGNVCTQVSGAQVAGLFKLILNSPATWTGSGAGMAPARYAVLYNDTPTSPAKPLIGWWDYLSSFTLSAGATFTVSMDGVNGVLQKS